MVNRHINCYIHPVSWQVWWNSRTLGCGLVRRERFIHFSSSGCYQSSLYPDPSPFTGDPNFTFCVLFFFFFFLIGCRSLGWLPSCYWSVCAPCTSRELEVPAIFIPWWPLDNEWVVQDNESLPAFPESRQIQKHTIEFILTSLGGHFGIRLAVEVESPVDYFKHLSDVFRDVKTTGLW